MKKRILSLALALAVVMGLAACGKQTPSGSEVNSASSARDDFKFAYAAEPLTFDPSQTKDSVSLMFLYEIYDRLVDQDAKDPTHYVPGLATDWEFSDGGKKITFTIRDGVKFHNGDLLTTEDLVWALELVRNGGYTSHLNDAIDHFEVIDDSHIQLLLNYAYAPILDILSNPNYSIVCRSAYEKAQSTGSDFGREPIGSGPYKLVEWRNGTSMKFEAFENYWEGEPAIKYFEGIYMSDNSSAAIALEAGNIDWASDMNRADVSHLLECSNLQPVFCPNVGVYAVYFNCQNGPFADPLVRQAVAYAINADDVILGGVEGFGTPADCFVPYTLFGYVSDSDWYQQNISKAKELLTQAGYPNGFTCKFAACTEGSWMASIEVVVEQLRQIGIDCELDKMDRAAYMEDVANLMNYEISWWAINANVNDADYVMTRRLHSSQIGGTNNFSNYVNLEADKLIEEAREETDTSRRLDIYSELYSILKEDLPYMPVYSGQWNHFFNADLGGVYEHPMGRYTWKYFYWKT